MYNKLIVMKRVSIALLFFNIACHSADNSEKKVTPANNQQIVNKVVSGDTMYKVGLFLIPCNKDMKLDVINRANPPHTIKSKGDTLYCDDDTVILGDDRAVKDGILKRFKILYDSSMFKVKDIYKGPLAKPNIERGSDASWYRTMIRECCKDAGINFAGHYTIAEWRIGSEAMQMAVVDRINGKVWMQDEGFGFSDCTAGSRMITINSDLMDSVHKGYYLYRLGFEHYRIPEIYVWENNEFKKIE